MKRLILTIFMVWIFSHRSMCLIRSDGAEIWLDQQIAPKVKMTSNLWDTTCRILADAIQKYSINPPFINRVSFQLRTSCRIISATINEAEKLLKAPEFNVHRKTTIFIAGWMTNPTEDYIEEMVNAYRCRGDSNFLVFNNGGFLVNEYMNAAFHTKRLGEFVALGLERLKIYPENIHLVGHSLGAHIAGSAGRYYYKYTGRKLARITALDPARPCFRSPATFQRLSRNDAAFVDIIHSNPYDVGTEEQIGHVDFYPGGLDVIKPGCSCKILMCSHELSIQYFIETLYPGNEYNFIANHCASHKNLKQKFCYGQKAVMGYASGAYLRGMHYLPVQEQWPYGLNARRNVTFKSSSCGRCINAF